MKKLKTILLVLFILILTTSCQAQSSNSLKSESESKIDSKLQTIIPKEANSKSQSLFYIKRYMQNIEQIQLTVVKRWNGTGNTVIEYDTNFEPLVLNVYSTKISNLAGDFLVSITATNAEIENRVQNQGFSRFGAVLIDSESVEYIKPNMYTSIIKNSLTGKVAIRITAVGYSWNATLGKE